MAEPNEKSEPVRGSGNAAAPEIKAELPSVESPPLSPADIVKSPDAVSSEALPSDTKPANVEPPAAAAEPVTPAPFAAAPDADQADQPQTEIKASRFGLPPIRLPHITVSRRLRRSASLAATVMIAAGLGAAVGSALDKRTPPPAPQSNLAALEDNHAMQKTIARLSKELSTLKVSIENANKDSRSQIAKLADRIDRAPETTGSIAKPAAAAAAEKSDALSPPMPQPRPAIVQGWTVHEVRNGVVWVEGRGELYSVVPGVPLPGLGTVESIRREGNQWIVVTSKGIITSSLSSAAIRPRPYYPPYYRPF